MKPLSTIDMAAVTRLTREGRLAEAMQLLRGDPAEPAPAAAQPADGKPPIIDMQPPSAANGGAWTAPGASSTPPPPPRASSASATSAPRAPAASAPPSPATFASALHTHAADASASPSAPRSPLRATLERALKPRIRPAGTARQPADALPPGARFEERTHGNALAGRSYKLYVPSTYDGTPRALVVMLHGCTQSPDDFARGTRMNALAEEHGFLVAYPAQSQTANASKCWNWFNAADQQRDRGEPALIAGITREVMAEFAIDPNRVYVAGLSAGGAMAAILGAAYPDLYTAVGVHSGLAPGAAHDMPSAFAAMRSGGTQQAARSARTVPTIVFHGDADTTVAALNGEHVAVQARGIASLQRQTHTGRSADGIAYTRRVESSNDGRPQLEHWLIHGGSHAWSGGDASGSYTAPHGPDASREMLRFFAEQAAAKAGTE